MFLNICRKADLTLGLQSFAVGALSKPHLNAPLGGPAQPIKANLVWKCDPHNLPMSKLI